MKSSDVIMVVHGAAYPNRYCSILQNLCYNCQFLCWCGNQTLCDKISKAIFCVCKSNTVDHTLSQKSLTSKNITLTYILPYIIITILCILEYIWCLVHMGGLIFHHTSLTLMACTLKLKTFQDI